MVDGDLALSKAGIPFNKMQPRKPLLDTRSVSFLNNNSVVLDNIRKYEGKISKFKSVSTPDFKLSRGRQSRDPRMPLFMDGVNSRMALNMLNRKMLETNHFDHSYYCLTPQDGARMAQTAGPSGFFNSQSQGSK